MRPENWPALLDEYVDAARSRAFEWGVHDCVTFSCGWFALMTGSNPAARFAGEYSTEVGAGRIMLAHEVRGMDDAGRFLFGPPSVAGASYVKRGDIVLARGALGISIAGGAAFLSADGVEFAKASEIVQFWDVS